MPTKNNTPAITQLEAEGRDPHETLLLQSAVLGKLYDIHDELKKEIGETFSPGESKKIANAQGLELGSMSMSKPKKIAVCDDKSILLGMAEEEGYDLIDGLPGPSDPRHEEIIKLLLDSGREDLLETTIAKEDREKIQDKVFQTWQITGELATGFEIRDASKPSFRLTKKRTAEAQAAIDYLTNQAGAVMGIDTTKALAHPTRPSKK